jgi:hypothetical protein
MIIDQATPGFKSPVSSYEGLEIMKISIVMIDIDSSNKTLTPGTLEKSS